MGLFSTPVDGRGWVTRVAINDGWDGSRARGLRFWRVLVGVGATAAWSGNGPWAWEKERGRDRKIGAGADIQAGGVG